MRQKTEVLCATGMCTLKIPQQWTVIFIEKQKSVELPNFHQLGITRRSFDHQYQALYREHEDVLPLGDIPCIPLSTQDWLTDQEVKAEIQFSVPGTYSMDRLPADLKALTPDMIETKYIAPP